MVKLTINDKLVEVPEGTTILQAARQEQGALTARH